jgi:hypothetical protein
MKTFEEILDEELEIALGDDNSQLGDVRPSVNRAAIRFANQQTQELEAKILFWRKTLWGRDQEGFDAFFGITNMRAGE